MGGVEDSVWVSDGLDDGSCAHTEIPDDFHLAGLGFEVWLEQGCDVLFHRIDAG